MRTMEMLDESSSSLFSDTLNCRSSISNNNATTKLERLVQQCHMELMMDSLLEKESRKSLGDSSSSTTSSTGVLSSLDDYEMKLEDYEALRQLPGNDKCADCGAPDTDWACITFF